MYKMYQYLIQAIIRQSFPKQADDEQRPVTEQPRSLFRPLILGFGSANRRRRLLQIEGR